MDRSWTPELPVVLFPKPRILPPLVLVVENQASPLNVVGPNCQRWLAAEPVPVPLKVAAVLPSPARAPAVPTVTPEAAIASSVPTASASVVPLASPRRQYEVAPSDITAFG